MDPTTLGVLGAVDPSAGKTSATTGVGALDSDAFLKLLVAQLRYQDPMSPSDPTTMMSQTASFSQVESLQMMAQVQQQQIALQKVVIGTQMVGRKVTATTDDGRTITGAVSSVRFTIDGPVLRIGHEEVALERASQISDT